MRALLALLPLAPVLLGQIALAQNRTSCNVFLNTWGATDPWNPPNPWEPNPWDPNPNPWDPNPPVSPQPGYGLLQGRCTLSIDFRTQAGSSPSFSVEIQGQQGEFQRIENQWRLPFTYDRFHRAGVAWWDDNRNGQGTVVGSFDFSLPNWRSQYVWIRAVIDGERKPVFQGNVNTGWH